MSLVQVQQLPPLNLNTTTQSSWVFSTMNIEQDPNGVNSHTPGAKLDAGKPRPALVMRGFARALKEVVKIGTFGAKKYTDNGWEQVPNGYERYSDAMMRHWLDEATGEKLDPQSELMHAAHFAWNALATLELLVRKQEAEAKADQTPIATTIWRATPQMPDKPWWQSTPGFPGLSTLKLSDLQNKNT